MSTAAQPDALEVPKLTSPPVPDEAVLYHIAFVHHLLTRLFEHGGGLLHAEYRRPPSGAVSWYVCRKDDQTDGPETPVASSANPSFFRAALARFGFLYIGDPYGGYATVVLSQENRKWRCHFFMANIRHMGFWIRVYAHPE